MARFFGTSAGVGPIVAGVQVDLLTWGLGPLVEFHRHGEASLHLGPVVLFVAWSFPSDLDRRLAEVFGDPVDRR